MTDDFRTDDSRARILDRIAASLGREGSVASASAAADYSQIPRDYRARSEQDNHSILGSVLDSILDLFIERLREYDAGCKRVASPGDLPAAIAATLAARGKSKAALAVVAGIPAEWLPSGFDFPLADPLTPAELDQVAGILTGCTVAIAETGSLVLQSGPRQGLRRHTLVPDYHLCIVFESQLVARVPDAFPRLDPRLPTTFISGPSATADIEMTRIKGVHGPRTLDVLLVVD